MGLMKGIMNKMTGCDTKSQEYDAILYGIDDIIESGYKANNVYNPNEHKVLIDTYSGAMEKLNGMSFLKKGKQKKVCSQLKADIEKQNDVFRTVYDSILSVEEPSVKTTTKAVEDAPVIDKAPVKTAYYENMIKQQVQPIDTKNEDSVSYTEKLQSVYSSVRDTASTIKDIVKDNVPNISASNLKANLETKALFNPRATYAAGLITLFGARTVGAMVTQNTSNLTDSLYDIDYLGVLFNETAGNAQDAIIRKYTGNLTADVSVADSWEGIITHPDFTATQDFEEAFGRLYGIDASEISNLPEELQARIREIQEIYAQNLLVDTPIAETMGEGELVEWGNDGKDVYTAENYSDLIEKTGPANTLVNEYSISDKINVAVESGYEVKVHAYNDDWTRGPTGAIIELAPADEADITDSGSALTKENITLEDAVKGSFGEDETSKEFHIVEDRQPHDNNIPPVAFATANPDDGTVMKTMVGDNGNSYICVGFEPPKYNADGQLIGLSDRLTSPWGQLDALIEEHSSLFPSGGSGGSAGTAPDDGSSGGGRDGGDEY